MSAIVKPAITKNQSFNPTENAASKIPSLVHLAKFIRFSQIPSLAGKKVFPIEP